MAGLVLLYTARVVFKTKVTMKEIVFSVKHSWRFLDSAGLKTIDSFVLVGLVLWLAYQLASLLWKRRV